MANDTKIEWSDATFNCWRGCTKVSDGCKNCYAEKRSRRIPKTFGVWGPLGTRVVAAEATWKDPVRWNRLAGEGKLPNGSVNPDGRRPRVFCASLADVFEGPTTMPVEAWDAVAEARSRLFALIDRTPRLDWLLVTKRPENVVPMLEQAVSEVYCPHEAGAVFAERWLNVGPPPNVWLLTSVEDQEAADRRIPELLKVPAVVHGLSAEPLLGPVDLGPWLDDGGRGRPRVTWVIAGGESGPGSRPCGVEWVRSVVSQCRAASVPVFVKQLGANPVGDDTPEEQCDPASGLRVLGLRRVVTIKDRKGGDIGEWPSDLQVREFPELPVAPVTAAEEPS